MRFKGALIKERGLTFAVAIVAPHILNSTDRESTRNSFAIFFPPETPIILVAQDSKGNPTYHGRANIVNFLLNVDFRRIPWKTYKF